jgi:DNA-binding LacI/PurR family transcriptional regulator
MGSIRQNAIADKLKLSVATVSRSLANHPSISVETRTRVLRLAEELGYKKSAARSSKSPKGEKKPITIGVLIGLQANSSPHATFPLILKGINERAEHDHVKVEVNYVDPNDFNPEAWGNVVVRQIRKGAWRGIILVYPYSPKVVEVLARRTSIVSTMEDYDNLNIDSIDTSHQTGIVRMVERLVSLGHRRIGFVTWAYPFTGHWSAQRFAAYVNAVFTLGIEFRQDWVFNVHKAARSFSPGEIADEAAKKIRLDGVTAWICAADHQAYPLIADLQARGIRVPDDCSVTGFDGIEPPPTLRPVTSLRVPSEAIGVAAIARLMNRIKHPKVPKRKILVETEFIEGTTIAPPPSRAGAAPGAPALSPVVGVR